MLKKKILSLFAAFVLCLNMMAATNAEGADVVSYALLSPDSTTLVFYCDTLAAEREGSVCQIFGNGQHQWLEASGKVEHVAFDSSFGEAVCTDMSGWFEDMALLEDVTGLQYVNTANITKIDRMFCGCSSLQEIDFSAFILSPGVTASQLLSGCSSLATLKVNGSMTGISTDACQGVGSQEQRCVIIASDDFDFWSSTSITDVEWKSGLFTLPPLVPYVVIEGDPVYSTMTFFCDRNPYNLSDEEREMMECHFLKDNNYERTWEFPNDEGDWVTVDVIFDPSFAMARPTSTASWFYSPVNAATLDPEVMFNFDGMEYLNTSMVEDMSNMFSGCTQLAEIDLEDFDTSSATSMEGMFRYCKSLQNISLSGFHTHNVTNMSGMFYGCSHLETLDLQNFDTRNVTDMSEMFYGCTSLAELNLEGFNTANVEDMHRMFANCHSLVSLNIGSFTTSKVVLMEGMFARCGALESLDVSSFDTSSVIDMSGMFYMCSSLSAINLDNFNTSAVEDMGNMFGGCESLETLKLSTLDMSAVERYESAEYYLMEGKDEEIANNVFDGFLNGCTALDTLYIPLSFRDIPYDAFTEVGLLEPCVLIVPDGYDFGNLVITDPLQWCGGIFKLIREDGDDGTLCVEASKVLAGNSGSIVVSFVNGYHYYNGFQFELHLPEGVSLAKDGSRFAYSLDERCGAGMTATIRDFGNGSYRVLCYSLSNDTIRGTSGAVITLDFDAGADIQTGVYEAFVTNVIFSHVDGVSVDVADVSFDIAVDNFPLGDIDHDYKVNVVDVMLVINHILGTTGSSFHKESADINRDGRIDVTDVMAIVVAILNRNVLDRAEATVLMPEIVLLPSDRGMELQMEYAGCYTACQMRVELAGEEAAGIVAGDGAACHRVLWQRIGHGIYNVVVWPMQGEEIRSGAPLLKILTASGNSCDVRVSNITLADKECRAVTVEDTETVATGIHAGGVVADESPAYRIDGVKSGSHGRGIYVKNGRKYMRK